jgi:MFS family permease
MIVACALFMENMDATVIATALPTIARSFGESPLQLNLAITAYLLALGIFLPLSGWLAGMPCSSALARSVTDVGSCHQAGPLQRCPGTRRGVRRLIRAPFSTSSTIPMATR